MGKRSWSEFKSDSEEQASEDHPGLGVGGAALSSLKKGNEGVDQPQDHTGDWKVATSKRKRKQNKRKKIAVRGSPDEGKQKYPSIYHSSECRLTCTVKLADLQCLILYLLADGCAPHWVAVRKQNQIRKVVVIMVPGLESGMFDGSIALEVETRRDGVSSEDELKDATARSHDQNFSTKNPWSPDQYYPTALDPVNLQRPLAPLADVFKQVWPMQAPGDDRTSRLFSPMQAILTAAIPQPKGGNSQKQKGPQAPKYEKDWEDKPVDIAKLVATVEQLQEEQFTVHPTLFTSTDEQDAEAEKRKIAKQTRDEGWIDSKVWRLEDGDVLGDSKNLNGLTAGRSILALDCEMCLTEGGESELTRITVLSWDGSVMLDELVKPQKPITNYLTRYSGITEKKLESVSTSLQDIQNRLLELLTPQTIVVGHSLNSDFAALKMTHPFIVDTSLAFPHPRGPPFKSSLKWLAQKYLSRSIQTGSQGHDPVEDALAALDLIKLKCQKGLKYGTPEASGESLFKRLEQSDRLHHPDGGRTTGAIVDWGSPRRGYGAAADVCIGCENDDEVVAGIHRAINGDSAIEGVPGAGVNLVWGRLRELEAKRHFWDKSKSADNDLLRKNAREESSMEANANGHGNPSELTGTLLGAAVGKTVSRLKEVYDSLPSCTALMVYSGTGDPRELSRLQEMHQQFKKEYQVKKWDELSVHWTDVEEQQLKRACRRARAGIGFVTVK